MGKAIIKRSIISAACLALFSTMATAGFNCSTSFDWGRGDPLGIRTLSKAEQTLNHNLAPVTYLVSDITDKGLNIPREPGGPYLIGTPFDDFAYVPDGVLAMGLNGGYDTFLIADPGSDNPGKNKVAAIQGSVEDNGTKKGDRFIVGDKDHRYFAGKNKTSDSDNDIVYIDKFDTNHSVIRLHGQASDYRLVHPSMPLDLNLGFGTAIVTKDTCDTIAYVRNKLLFNLSGANFEYASVPSATTAVSTASQSVNGVFQLGGKGTMVWAGTKTTIDSAGNSFSTFAISNNEDFTGASGAGSFVITKRNSAGQLLWTKRHGTTRGIADSEGGQTPTNITINNGFLYVSGITLGPYGSTPASAIEVGEPLNRPVDIHGIGGTVSIPPVATDHGALITLPFIDLSALARIDGIHTFVGKYSLSSGDLVAVKQIFPVDGLEAGIVQDWALEFDDSGDFYIGGSVSTGIQLPFAQAYITKVDGDTLDKVSAFGNNGTIIFNNGPVTKCSLFTLDCIVNGLNNLQISNFTNDIKFVDDGTANGVIYAAGTSDNGAFFGSEAGWNAMWYIKLDAVTGDKKWQGNYACDGLGLDCRDTGGYSLSSTQSDLFTWAIDTDSAGNLYIGGSAAGNINATGHVEETVSTFFKDTHKGEGDGLVVKINGTNGDVKWIRHLGTSASDGLVSLKTDGNNVYVTGNTHGGINGSSRGESDAFAIKLDSNGTIVKQLQLGSERTDSTSTLSITADKVYIGGTTEGSFVQSKNTDAGADAYLINVSKSAF